jgi:hypothetical protein
MTFQYFVEAYSIHTVRGFHYHICENKENLEGLAYYQYQ